MRQIAPRSSKMIRGQMLVPEPFTNLTPVRPHEAGLGPASRLLVVTLMRSERWPNLLVKTCPRRDLIPRPLSALHALAVAITRLRRPFFLREICDCDHIRHIDPGAQ